ncbi:hypothetical protein PR002_g4088 [Phytophthora rubi]|uniref:Uncharacterized protein n=1 Tax=Phytophthora rubi TaxID=129364 RepID=A0A6A3NKJ6_9STRA|nr:hypothetical protein PR002_g4088 [Phytophthora rubi]
MGEKRTLVPRHLSNRSDLGPSDTDGFEAADSGVDTLSVPRGWNPASLAASDCHLQRRWSPRRVPLRPYLRRLASTGVPTQVKNSLSFFRISSLGQRARHSPFLVVLRTSKPTLALTSPPTPTPCPGRRSPSSTREVENLSKLLRNEHGEDGVLVSQHEFWVDFRARVAQSGSSTGLEALYDLAMAMFNGDDAAVLTGAVVLLPAPDTMAAGTAPYHPLFSPEAASPHASSKRPAPRGSGKAKAPPAKKQRKAPKKAIFTFNLPSSTPAMIKIALANIVQKKVAIYNEKKFARSDQADDDSDFEDDDGEYTATGPTPPVQASVSQGGGSDDDELSHSGLAEDSEELGGEGGDVAGKSGQGKSGGRSPGDGGGSVKPRSSKSSGGSASVDKPKDSGKAGDGSSSGDTTASPSADPPSDALEDKPPAPTGGVNLAGTKWTSKSG